MTIIETADHRFYVDRVTIGDDQAWTTERWLDGRDAYLEHHMVGGTGTLPGCLGAELAAEAVCELLPDLYVRAIHDLTFHRFLKTGGSAARGPIRVVARLLHRDDEQAIVDVEVLGDVIAPSGTVLVRNRRYLSATLTLGTELPIAPVWNPWPAAAEVTVPDPYLADDSAVKLSGPFISSTPPRLHPLGTRAWYTKPIVPSAGMDEVFGGLLMPVLLMDGLLRLTGIDLINERYIPVAAPTAIRRIELYTSTDDARLSNQDPPIELLSLPRGHLLGTPGVESRGVALLSDGRVLLQIKGVIGVPFGYYDLGSGRHVALADVEDGRALRPSPRVGVVPL